MTRPQPVQIDTDTWIIMRDHPDHPKGIVHRVTDTSGTARFLLLVWHPEPSKRRMHGIYTTLNAADEEVKYDMTKVEEIHRMNARHTGPNEHP